MNSKNVVVSLILFISLFMASPSGLVGDSLNHLSREELQNYISDLPANTTFIDLGGCSNTVDDDILKLLGSTCSKLTHVSLVWCTKITSSGLKELLSHNPDLEYLDLSECWRLGWGHPIFFTTNFPKLRCLRLDWCDMLTSSDYAAIVASCPQLEELSLLYCNCPEWETAPAVTDELMRMLRLGCPRLRTLQVPGGYISEKGIQELASETSAGPSELTTLYLYWGSLSESSLIKLAQGCPKFQNLRLWGVRGLTDNSLKSFVVACPGLKSLHFSWVKGLSSQGIVSASHDCKNLETFYMKYEEGINDDSIIALVTNCPRLVNLGFDKNKVSNHVLNFVHEYFPFVRIDTLNMYGK